MVSNRFHFLMMLTFGQTRESVMDIFSEEELDDLILLEILEEQNNMIKLNIEHHDTLLQSRNFSDFMKNVHDKYKNEGRL